MPQHRIRAGHITAALVLVLASGAACGPADDAATTAKTGSAPAAHPSSPATAATAAAPNGVDKLQAAAILARARKATGSAQFLRMRGNIDDGKDKYALDISFAGKTKAAGWFQQGNQRLEMIRIGKDLYIKGNNAFWKAIGGKGAVQLFSGKHLKTTTTAADFKDLAAFTDRTALFNEAVKSGGTWEKAGTGTVDGTPAVRLTGAPGEEIHVATHGEPYVLRMDGGPGNRIEYLAYEKPVQVERPPAGTIVDSDAFK